MSSSSRRATLFAWTLIIALILPLLAACGGQPATPEVSPPPADTPASPAPIDEASPAASPEDMASPEASPEDMASPEASPEAETDDGATAAPPEPAEVPINDKILIAGNEQEPETLWGVEATSLAVGEVVNPTGDCVNTLSYEFQPTYCFDEFPTFENGGAVTETVEVNPDEISEDNPIMVGGALITDTAIAEEQGIDIPEELPQLTLTWNLNPELYWEDGEPVTAADVQESFRILQDPATVVPVRRIIDATQSVEAQDDHTLVQTMVPGYLEFTYFVDTWLGFAPAHIYGGMSIEEIRATESVDPFAFGPYMVESHEPGVQTTLVNNPYFPEQPNIGTIIFKYVADANQLLAQLETGEIDVPMAAAMNLSMVPRLDELAEQGEIETNYVPATFWEHVDFGIQRGDGEPSFFEDVRVRQAFAYGVNRQEIVDEVQLGTAKVMNTIVPEDHPSFPQSGLEEYPYDADRARQLLDEAGWVEGADGIRERDGRRMSMTLYTTTGRPDRQAVAEIMQQNLREIGVEIELEFVAGPEVLFLQGSEGILQGRRFDLAMYAFLSGPTPGLALYLCDQIPTEENSYSGQNNPGYCNEEYDEAALTALAALDPEEKYELDQEPLTIINRDLPTLPLYQRSKIGTWRSNVTGIEIDPSENFTTHNIQEWDIEEE